MASKVVSARFEEKQTLVADIDGHAETSSCNKIWVIFINESGNTISLMNGGFREDGYIMSKFGVL